MAKKEIICQTKASREVSHSNGAEASAEIDYCAEYRREQPEICAEIIKTYPRVYEYLQEGCQSQSTTRLLRYISWGELKYMEETLGQHAVSQSLEAYKQANPEDYRRMTLQYPKLFDLLEKEAGREIEIYALECLNHGWRESVLVSVLKHVWRQVASLRSVQGDPKELLDGSKRTKYNVDKGSLLDHF